MLLLFVWMLLSVLLLLLQFMILKFKIVWKTSKVISSDFEIFDSLKNANFNQLNYLGKVSLEVLLEQKSFDLSFRSLYFRSFDLLFRSLYFRSFDLLFRSLDFRSFEFLFRSLDFRSFDPQSPLRGPYCTYIETLSFSGQKSTRS